MPEYYELYHGVPLHVLEQQAQRIAPRQVDFERLRDKFIEFFEEWSSGDMPYQETVDASDVLVAIVKKEIE